MALHGSLLSVGSSWSEQPMENASRQLPGRQLRVVTLHDPPYMYAERQPDGSYVYDGYLYQLWQTIARQLNISYAMETLHGVGYGSLTENGTWTGLVGELAYGRADVGLTWLQIRPDRKAVVDFLDTISVAQADPTFYIQHGHNAAPQVTPSMFSALLKPLHSDIWWLLLAFLLLMSLALHGTLRFNHARAEDRQTMEDMTWHSCLLSSFMTLVSQGWASTPSSLSARIVIASCWVLSILISANYTANLISHLTVTSVDRPISSLKQFVEQPGWLFAIEPGYSILNDWKTSSSPYERELYRRTETGEGYIRLDVGDESGRRTTQPNVMTYIDIDRLLFTQGAEACHLVPLLDELPIKQAQYLAIAQGLEQTKQAINQLMQKLKQRGIMSRLQTFWLTETRDMCDNSASVKEMSISDMLAVLAIMPVGLVLCVAVFVLECVLFRVMPTKRRSHHDNAMPTDRRQKRKKQGR